MNKIISGKVRDVFEINEKELVIVTTDRISAFDVILKSTIPDKGIALNLISSYWFDYTSNIIPNHIVSTNLSDMPAHFSENPAQYDKRTVLVRKLNMLPYEFIVRGYMFGSMWEEYKISKTFCGQKVNGDYKLAEKLAEPIVTPSVKNNTGHDEYISLERLRTELGTEDADIICDICLKLYKVCYEQAFKNGIIIADTKFEFGYDEDGTLVLGDEIFTPDSSRFWALNDYQTGISPKSYDKQFVRDWLIEHKLNGITPAPKLPEEIVKTTADIYKECCRRITGQETNQLIRQIEKADIPKCVHVIRESFLTVANEFHFTPENAPRFTAFATDEQRLIRQYDENRPMYAYYDGEEIVGYYSLEMKANKECELNNLCVLPAYRHKNIGSQLLMHAFSYAAEHGCTKIHIGIVEENQVLRKWYEKYGFKHIGTQKFDFFPFTCGYMEKEFSI